MSGIHEVGTVINIIGGILLAYGYLPQIYTLLKGKTAGNNTMQYWTIMTFGIFCVGVNQFIYHLPLVQLITQCFNVGLAFICTCLIIYYKGKDKKRLAEKVA